jgi:curved DNA-binding protein CbpA
VATKNHYDVLEVAPTAAPDEIKRAFRKQIARYHPDKVQHLGEEFQEIAAVRAAELTEAYRILSNEAERAAYDRSLAAGAPAIAAVSPPAGVATAPEVEGEERPPTAAKTPFATERATRDQFVRKATTERIRRAIAQLGTEYSETEVRGFDIALAPKPRLFGGKQPRLFGRFIEPVDRAAVSDTWALAVRAVPGTQDELCVLLFGSSVAPARELAAAIAEQRRKGRGAKVTLIPIDVRTWEAHVPIDAPVVCRDLLTRLRAGV